ncbi:MAG: ORF6N domain-containing protein, partial [Deltaproteobacteria bacterium]|nr:ORF6N domain-containing protein [Deltaproteobacteria bacterium]
MLDAAQLDRDLAELYGVTVRRLREQVRRNRAKFPSDFLIELRLHEKNELVANCDRFDNIKHSNTLPLAFTEHGAIMAASVLNSQAAIETSIFVVRAFVRL